MGSGTRPVQTQLLLKIGESMQNICELLKIGESMHTDKKENQIFLICREIQSGTVAKSYMTNGLLIYGEIFSHFLI